MAAAASDFQKFITEARERKKNEALADRIFSRGRRQSAPPRLKGALASRVGVKKRTAAAAAASGPSRGAGMPPAGDVEGEWTHDLHDSINDGPAPLSSRITGPGASGRGKPAPAPTAQRKARLSAALDRIDADQVNVVGNGNPAPTARAGMGISIRGLAGPFAVMGQNFAPGTTAADIESAMTPVGGDMVSCRIVKTSPFVLAEMVFSSREGGERVIDTFDNKTADGKILKVYPKVGGGHMSWAATATAATTANSRQATAPSSSRGRGEPARDVVVDGRLGFAEDLMDVESASPRQQHQLYSDRLVAGNRRPQGQQRGGGGR